MLQNIVVSMEASSLSSGSTGSTYGQFIFQGEIFEFAKRKLSSARFVMYDALPAGL